ncbi:AMP-binding protein [Albimonas pacifica]|uniref:Acyl-CoA synthetase (AMP-forming)/AMP-acid ligase II n=1 Tax=Albimonas pacifica TaxID=1114924 RepID=A0A1I3DB75_9RHOB|nr:AMP-binding protein [Albimonas pacifica]SFH83953.1 Acyl-CoA synthetase (AMP-forming)/AMP-acid ligase II [Albimonas pacifica]
MPASAVPAVASNPSPCAADPFRSILAHLDDRAAGMGAVEAFRFHGDESRDEPEAFTSWTWAGLHARVAGVAAELRACGAIARGDRVLVAFPAGLAFIAAFLGCLAAGAVPTPVPPPRRRERLSRWAHIARDSGAAALLCAPELRDRLGEAVAEAGVAHILLSEAADPARPAPEPGAAWDQPGPGDLAFLQYTSGSTGAPKGVMITHGMLSANLEQIRHAFRFRPSDRIAGWLPHYHDMGLIGGILTPVRLGVPNAMMSPAAFLRDPIRYLELASRSGATLIGGPNFGYEHCLRHASPEALARVDLSGLRLAFSGAEAIRAETLRRFAQTFAPRGFRPELWVGCYGLAEATLCVSVTPPDGAGARALALDAEALAAHRIAPGHGAELVESGAVAPGIELAIVDPASRTRLPPDAVGEIWLRGASVARGCWGREDAEGTFDQRLDGQGGWLRTGDLGARVDGRLYVAGRLKELIVVRGRNLHPQDLEATATAAHPDLLPGRAAAFALDAGGDGDFALACELHRSACRAPRSAEIFAALRRALADRHGVLPARLVLLRPGALPATPSGKIQRFAVRDGLAPGGWLTPLAEHARAAPQDPQAAPPGALAQALRAAPPAVRRARLLAHLRAALARATGDDAAIAEDVGLFDLGLDSAGGVALVAGLERDLDLALDATLIYEHATLATLGDHLLGRLFPPDAPPSGAGPGQSAHAPLASENRAPQGARDVPASDDDDEAMRALEALLASDP